MSDLSSLTFNMEYLSFNADTPLRRALAKNREELGNIFLPLDSWIMSLEAP